LTQIDGEQGRVVCFGEMLLRLSAPAGVPLSQAQRFAADVGGAEANVAAALAQLGHDVHMATILPDNALGEQAAAALRRHGVRVEAFRGPGRLGLYYFEPGAGPRASRIIYDRVGSLFSERAGELDWPKLLDGARWLHVSGITVALGDVAAAAVLAAARAARAAGAKVSFDCNYRPSLWVERESQAPAILAPIVREADLMFGNHRDVALLTGKPLGGDSEADRRAAAQSAFAAFPNLGALVSTMRRIGNDGAHELSARIDLPGSGLEVKAVRIDGIVDRIGSGDAFVAAVIDGIRSGLEDDRTLERGLAAAALKQTITGDQWIGTSADLDDFYRLRGSDIRR
jgi:2-dehydro-3-deoxygluconokinase